MKHSTVISATGLWQDSGTANTNVGSLITSSLYNPVYVAPRTATGLSHIAPLASRRINQSVAIADTMSVLDDRMLLTVGGRWQGIDITNFNTTGAVTSRPQNEAITPAVALVVKPINNLSLYGNYIEGLTSGGIAPIGAVNVGQVFPAIVAKQIEVGAKYDFGSVGVSLAAFEITQPNGFTNPATNVFSVDGEQRNRGLEFNTFGEVAPGLRLLGGVSLIDGVQTKTAGGLFDGRSAVGVPDVQFNL